MIRVNYTKIPQNEVEERYECPNCGAPPFIPLHNSVEFENYRPMCHICGAELVEKNVTVTAKLFDTEPTRNRTQFTPECVEEMARDAAWKHFNQLIERGH